MSTLRPAVSPYFYLLVRAALGLYLATHFFMLVPYAWELFSSAGMLPRAVDLPTYPYFPNVLFLFDGPTFTTLVVAALGVMSLVLAAGRGGPVVPLLLWYGWACLLTRNVFIRNPGIPYVGWILLAISLVPPVRPSGDTAPAAPWNFPRPLYVTAWVLMALGYTMSGLHKLQSPSWLDGTALQRLSENPLARPTLLSGLVAGLPPVFLQVATWAALALEITFAAFAAWRVTRPWIWLAMVGMHIGIMLLVDFVDLTVGMLMIHLLTFDQRWLTSVSPKGEPLVVYFDGVCSLCNAFIDALVREDSARSLRYAPLQGLTADSCGLSTHGVDPTSIIVSAGGRTYTESDAVLRIFAGLGGFWRLVAWLRVVPRPLRDRCYRLVARHRYRWFGRHDTCRIPSAAERALFLP